MFCVTLPCLLELSYTFEHIWTNLLTQCTQLPVPVFFCFCISGFPAIKSAPKIPKKLYKKSASRKPPESPRKERGPPQGLQKGPWRGPTLGRARRPPDFPVDPLGAPFGPYFYPRGGNPENRSHIRELPSVPPPPPFEDRGCQEKLPRHPAGRRNPLRETIHRHERLPDVP